MKRWYVQFRASIASIRAQFRRVVSKNTGGDQAPEWFGASDAPSDRDRAYMILRWMLHNVEFTPLHGLSSTSTPNWG